MKRFVDADAIPGLLTYLSGKAVGWIALARRDEYLRIADYGLPDNWVIGCVYLNESARGRGIAAALIRGAVDYARQHGAVTVEGIPRGWRSGGSLGAQRITRSFLDAGFQPVDPVTEGVSFRLTLPSVEPK
jgi:GNAT superfamily N-acetyltransferase